LTISVAALGAVDIVPVVKPIEVISVFAPLFAAVRLVLASAAVVPPVPPLATATVPVTLDAVPVVFWFRVGMSEATISRNTGTPSAPLGAARKYFAVLTA
jgi:hypothetical protein